MITPDGIAYASTTLIPEWNAWPSIGAAHRHTPPLPSDVVSADDLRSLRASIIRAAHRFTEQLDQVAKRHAVPVPAPNVSSEPADPIATDTSLVMTGHQPVVLHPGLVYKYQVTQEYADRHQATAVSILMDTDYGDAGAFVAPEPSANPNPNGWPVTGLRHESLSRTADAAARMYANGRVRSDHELSKIEDRVAGNLQRSLCRSAAETFRRQMINYRKLAGCSAVIANSVTRRAGGIANRIVELPFSDLCRRPQLQRFFAQILNDGKHFCEVYNESLEAWRSQRKIRNAANPFPNLRHRGDRDELPFWWVEPATGLRSELWIQSTATDTNLFAADQPITDDVRHQLQSGEGMGESFLVPKGALITITLRLLCCDLFVHGLGGHVYDQYTDQLIREYYRVDPPPFTAASASRYLHDPSRKRLEGLLELKSRQRDLAHHPENYLQQGWYSDTLERTLDKLIQRKHHLVASLKEKKRQATPASDVGRDLQQLQQEIKSLVAAEFQTKLDPLNDMTPAVRDAIPCRTYPWFFFDWNDGSEIDKL